MDPVTLAGTAIGLLSPYLTEAGKAAAKKIGEGAGSHLDGLLAVIRHKFGLDQDAYAAQTLSRLEEQPAAESRQRALADIVAEKAQADPAFKAELERLVQSAQASPTTTQILTNVYGNAKVGQIINAGRVDRLNIGSEAPQ